VVRLFGRHREKLRIAAALGIDARAPRHLPAGRFGFTVDATGSGEGLAQAVAMTRPRGMVILKSTVHGLVSVDTAPVIVNEISLVGSRCGRLQRALPLLRAGKVKVSPLISDVLPLREAPRAFARASEPGVLKVLLASGRAA
jgi:alcohol dehydrogenase